MEIGWALKIKQSDPALWLVIALSLAPAAPPVVLNLPYSFRVPTSNQRTMPLSKSTQSKLFRIGYLTKGLLYLGIGGFAVATVVGAAKSTNGPKGVIDWVSDSPFGQTALALVGIGLAAYALWRWYAAVADVEDTGSDMMGIIKRIGWAVSGTAYGLLAVYAFNCLLGSSSGGSDNGKEHMIATLLKQPYGPWLVGLIALIIAGVGIYQLYKGVTDKHMEGVGVEHLHNDVEDTFRYTGRIGLAARFVVYGIIAYFLFRAATLSDADKFRGIGDAMSSLRGGDFGSALLMSLGAGMLAYGLFMLVRARYERV